MNLVIRFQNVISMENNWQDTPEVKLAFGFYTVEDFHSLSTLNLMVSDFSLLILCFSVLS